jgi:hypothetical protein
LNQLNDARETATPLAIEHEAIETSEPVTIRLRLRERQGLIIL